MNWSLIIWFSHHRYSTTLLNIIIKQNQVFRIHSLLSEILLKMRPNDFFPWQWKEPVVEFQTTYFIARRMILERAWCLWPSEALTMTRNKQARMVILYYHATKLCREWQRYYHWNIFNYSIRCNAVPLSRVWMTVYVNTRNDSS